MSTINAPEQMLDLITVVSGLVKSQQIGQVTADDILSRPRTPEQMGGHPLEYLASLELSDSLGQPLDIDRLCHWLAGQAGQEFIVIDPLKIDVAAITPLMSHAFALRHQILAVAVSPGEMVVASAQPWHHNWEDNLRHVSRREIKRVVANPADIRRYTAEFYRLAQSVHRASANGAVRAMTLNNFEQMLELGSVNAPDANDQHIVNIVDWLMQYAFAQRASDIHIEPRREQCNLRFRIDGVLHTIYQVPAAVAAAVTSRLKILGRMDVAEKRRPQDGRLKTRSDQGREVELRLSTLPTAFGEKLVMRIFDPEVLVKSFSELGLSNRDEQQWRVLSQQSGGLILVTGPTGSGKTTTLYSTLRQLACEQVNICTIEDPIELVVPDFNQMQVQTNIDLTFASGLRALLRQDPDVIMVGEIRDLETARMAIQAALTGHLVLSTLHTSDAPSALTRMLELGIPPYLINSTVLGVMAQRLVRTLCPDCKTAASLAPSDWQVLTDSQPEPTEVCQPVGCPACRDTGYRGRTGIYELLTLSETIKTLVNDHPDIARLTSQCRKEGVTSLRQSGAGKVASGLTTIAEVLRVAP